MAVPQRRIKRILPFWTIWFPLSFGILFVLALFALIIFSSSTGNSQISMWSQIATVLLAVLFMLIGLFLLFFLVFGVIGTQKLANRLPGWLRKVNSFSAVNLARIRRVSTITGNMALFFETLSAQIESSIKLFGSKLTNKKD